MIGSTAWHSRRWTVAALFAIAHSAMAQHGAPSPPRGALDGILDAFASHRVVLLGESHYSIVQHRFIQRLLHDPRLPGRVTDIAVEFANARYQPLIDRYIGGADVPADSLRQVWQNTMVPLAWDPPMYAELFRTIRDLNRGLAPDHRFRVIALDPPIPWDSVHSDADIPRKWGYRDPAWTEALERESLGKGHKALVICGALHVVRLDPTKNFQPAPSDRAGLGDALGQRYGREVYSLFPVIGKGPLSAMTRGWAPGTMADVAGTTIGSRTSHLLMPGSVTLFTMVNGKRVPRTIPESEYPPIERMVDALVYYGPDASLAPPVVDAYRDEALVAELHRRSAVLQPIFGTDLDPQIDALRTKACTHGKCAGPRTKAPQTDKAPQTKG